MLIELAVLLLASVEGLLHILAQTIAEIIGHLRRSQRNQDAAANGRPT